MHNACVKSNFVRKVGNRSDLKLLAVGSEALGFVRSTGALPVASASGTSLDALQPAAIGYCQDTTGGVGDLA